VHKKIVCNNCLTKRGRFVCDQMMIVSIIYRLISIIVFIFLLNCVYS